MLDGLRSCRDEVRALSRGQKVLVGVALVLVTLWGGSKDGAWTNNAARVINRTAVRRTTQGAQAASSQTNVVAAEAPVLTTNAVAGEVPVFTTNDFERGFVLARVGMNEVFDFAPPEGATVCEKWRRRGGSSDCFRLEVPDWLWGFETRIATNVTGWAGMSADDGTNEAAARVWRVVTNETNRLRVFASGAFELRMTDEAVSNLALFAEAHTSAVARVAQNDGKTSALSRIELDRRTTLARMAPLGTTLGLVPQANWGRLPDGARPSEFWHWITPSNTLQLTWRNATFARDGARPVSTMAELWPDGRFVFRYDLSRIGTNSVMPFSTPLGPMPAVAVALPGTNGLCASRYSHFYNRISLN